MKRGLVVGGLVVLLATVVAGTVPSVSSIQYTSNSDFFSGEVFAIEYIADGSTDTITAVVGSDQLSDAADGEVQQLFSIDATARETYAQYGIGASGEPTLVQLDLITAVKDTESELNDWAARTCYDVDHDRYAEYHQKGVLAWDGVDYKGFCAYRNGQYGPIGDIDSGDEIFTTEFCAEASGEQRECATLSNGDAGSGVMTDLGQHTKIRWTGNLETGVGRPIPDDEYALHGNQFQDGWRIISQSRYQDWKSRISRLPNDYEAWAQGTLDREDLERDIDDASRRAASEYTQSSFVDAERIDSSFSSGQLRLDLEDTLVYPTFTVYVDAVDYITVEKPTGEPRIVATEGDEFGEIDTGTVSATVRNVGEYEGSFAVRITDCSDSFTFDSLQQTTTVHPGAEQTFSFEVAFTGTDTEKEHSGTCTVEAKDTGSGDRDFATIDVTGLQENECQPGEELSKPGPDGRDVIYKCDSDGVGLIKLETCPPEKPDTTKRDGEMICVEPQSQEETGFGAAFERFKADMGAFLENPLDNFLNKPLLAIDILATLLAVMVSFFIAQSKLVAPFVEMTAEASGVNETLLRFVIGVVIAVLAGYVTYALISQLWVKLVILVGAVLFAAGYVYIQAVLPG